MNRKDSLSVIIPVGSRVDDLVALIDDYAGALEKVGREMEFIVVLDGMKLDLLERLSDYAHSHAWLRIVQFSRQFGEASALMAGFHEARGDVILTLPAYWQVKPSELPRLIDAAGKDDDVLVAVRSPRRDSVFGRIRRKVFHGLLRFITGFSYRDLGCSVRLLTSEVADEISLYADQHRFLPALAVHRGFRVREMELAQSSMDRFRGRYSWREYVHRTLDLLTVFFLVRFTKKPLRFFGSLGFIAAGTGGVVVLVLVIQRLFFEVALADRPALLLGSLLIVLGVQLFGLGLLGELVIFAHGADSKEYAIRSIIGGAPLRTDTETAEQRRETPAVASRRVEG